MDPSISFGNRYCFMLLMAIAFVYCGTITVDSDLPVQERIHDHKLSDQEHYIDLDNDNKFEHNADYDHEAFLGKDEADKFKELTPEESKEKLGKIVDKIDSDSDGFVSEEELRNWIKNVSYQHILKDVESRWPLFEKENTIEQYIENNYGALNQWTEEEKEKKKDDYKTYQKLLARDKKRFKAADYDGDGKLNKKEYTDFLHPEETNTMRDVVIDETLEDLDKNGDGVVNIDEFISDIFPNENKDKEEPEWVTSERENFKKYRDKNSDGVMDREEVANWILPTDYDHTLSEAKHLIYESDENKDGKLTKEEILNKYSVFVASQATSFGHAIYEKEDL